MPYCLNVSTTDLNLWWQNASIYQIYPRTFYDSNNDGIGDLAGITQKINYIVDLGIDAIWLSPFYPSPQHDGGYDVSDPRNVARDLGGLSVFTDLVTTAKNAGIKIIVDLVPNHFSIEHRWFIDALNSSPGSVSRSRFHFKDGRGANGELPPNNWISLFGGSAWTRIKEPNGELGQWYLHIFDSSQPDLNWTNPEVQQDFQKTIRFWLDHGVNGFRVDVALGLAKDMTYADDVEPQKRVDAIRLDLFDANKPEDSEDLRKWVIDSPIFDRDEVHEYYKPWKAIFEDYQREVFAVAEAWAYPSNRTMAYAKSLGQVFNFDFMVVPFKAKILAQTINRLIESACKFSTYPTWVLSNHDTSRIVSRLGSLTKARAMAVLAHYLPGSAYIYQGEELGLPDANIPPNNRLDPIWHKSGFTQIGRDGARAPMPWNHNAKNRGFSQADETWLPSPKDWDVECADLQIGNPNSTFELYKTLLSLRHSHPIWKLPIEATQATFTASKLQVSRGRVQVASLIVGWKILRLQCLSSKEFWSQAMK